MPRRNKYQNLLVVAKLVVVDFREEKVPKSAVTEKLPPARDRAHRLAARQEEVKHDGPEAIMPIDHPPA